MKHALILAAALALSASASAEVCKPWSNPGGNKNTQWPSVSTAHYRPDLSDRVESRAYDEIVVVKGGRIIGESSGRSYSNLRDMHYGNGQYCTGPVELPPITENEFGFVYCTMDDRCVIDWFICHNISQVNRDASNETQSSRREEVEQATLVPGNNSSPDAGYPAVPEGSNGVPVYGQTVQSGFYSQGPGSFGGGGSACYCCDAPIAPAVPEPSTFLLLLAGLGVIYVKVHRQRNR